MLQTQALTLRELNARIRERQSDHQAFCHSLSHDFTGPLRRIGQLIEFALEDLEGGGREAPAEFELLRRAKGNSETLIELTKGLVEYLVADVTDTRSEVVDLEEIVSTVLSLCEEQGSMSPKVHLKTLPRICGRKAQIQIVFKNLFENAIKYNDNVPEITISHSEDSDNDQVLISIKDNGIGMDEKYLDTIFNPFTRLHTDSQYKGSGLGLSIVKKMVKNHHGEIRVESTLGAGSTFYITLPLPL